MAQLKFFAKTRAVVVTAFAVFLIGGFLLISRAGSTDWELGKARIALSTYFALLHDGRYAEAIKYHGSGWDYLSDWNPLIEPNDYVGLLKAGCERQVKCLEILKVVSGKKVVDGEYVFVVQFLNEDGSRFKRGPCCGGDGPTEEEFEFQVKKTDGGFVVLGQPLYVP